MKHARVVIFISGSGSNMEALIRASETENYPAKMIAVICDQAAASGLKKAQKYNIPTHVFERKAFSSKQEHEKAILDCLNKLEPDILCLAGYMRLISKDIINPYEGRILNIHPSLLPLFRGLNTHQCALNEKMKLAGCTVHLVTAGMDEGLILAQAAVPILSDDDAEILAARVLKAEHQLYPATLKHFIENTKSRTDPDQSIFSF